MFWLHRGYTAGDSSCINGDSTRESHRLGYEVVAPNTTNLLPHVVQERGSDSPSAVVRPAPVSIIQIG